MILIFLRLTKFLRAVDKAGRREQGESGNARQFMKNMLKVPDDLLLRELDTEKVSQILR